MNKLNQQELEMLQNGIREEWRGVRLHAWPPHETETLLDIYRMGDFTDEVSEYVITAACHEAAADWQKYFDKGRVIPNAN